MAMQFIKDIVCKTKDYSKIIVKIIMLMLLSILTVVPLMIDVKLLTISINFMSIFVLLFARVMMNQMTSFNSYLINGSHYGVYDRPSVSSY